MSCNTNSFHLSTCSLTFFPNGKQSTGEQRKICIMPDRNWCNWERTFCADACDICGAYSVEANIPIHAVQSTVSVIHVAVWVPYVTFSFQLMCAEFSIYFLFFLSRLIPSAYYIKCLKTLLPVM